MKLPNGDRAVVDMAKLRDYCLSPEHPVGKHKARVFASALNLTAAEADVLRSAIREAAARDSAEYGRLLEHGQLYSLDFDMSHDGLRARIKTGRIVRSDEDFPRLTTCYVL